MKKSFYILFVMLPLLAWAGEALKISQFPNVSVMQGGDMLLISRPGQTNLNISYRQLYAQIINSFVATNTTGGTNGGPIYSAGFGIKTNGQAIAVDSTVVLTGGAPGDASGLTNLFNLIITNSYFAGAVLKATPPNGAWVSNVDVSLLLPASAVVTNNQPAAHIGLLTGTLVFPHLDGTVLLQSADGANTLTWNDGASFWDFSDVVNGVFIGAYSGDGSGLGTLNASSLSSGTVPMARLPGRALVLTNADNGVLICATNVSQWFTTNASYTVTGFRDLVAGTTANPDITVSNSSGSDIIVTQPAGTIFWLGATNRVRAGGQLNFAYQIKLGVTNLLTAGTP